MNYHEYHSKVVGSLIQHGVDFMIGFNSHADVFIAKYQEFLPEVSAIGHSPEWRQWLEQNRELNIQLYNDLKTANLL